MATVLITGASRGLGLELARQYARDGWKVIATCRSPTAAPAMSGDVVTRALDVTDGRQIRALADDLAATPIDLLINNAGTHGPRDGRSTFGDIDVDAWMQVIRVNAIGALKVTEAFLAHVARSRDKKIAFVSSRAGSIAERGALPHHRPGGPYIYRSSKAALNSVAKALAFDLQPRGISVIVLHPGWVRTETGGWDAPGDVAASVADMRAVIARSTPADNGRFVNHDGSVIAW